MRNPIHVLQKLICEIGQKRSSKWPQVRKVWLKENPTCAACGTAQHVEVHHKIPFHLHPELELQPSNFITLCSTIFVEHHLKVGHTVDGHSSWKINNPNVVQDAKALLESSVKSKVCETSLFKRFFNWCNINRFICFF